MIAFCASAIYLLRRMKNLLCLFVDHVLLNQENANMRFIRKMQNTNPGAGRYPTVSIPADLCDIFKTDTAIIEVLPDRKGVIIRPTSVTALV